MPELDDHQFVIAIVMRALSLQGEGNGMGLTLAHLGISFWGSSQLVEERSAGDGAAAVPSRPHAAAKGPLSLPPCSLLFALRRNEIGGDELKQPNEFLQRSRLSEGDSEESYFIPLSRFL